MNNVIEPLQEPRQPSDVLAVAALLANMDSMRVRDMANYVTAHLKERPLEGILPLQQRIFNALEAWASTTTVLEHTQAKRFSSLTASVLRLFYDPPPGQMLTNPLLIESGPGGTICMNADAIGNVDFS